MQNPTHTYSLAGTYTVTGNTLTITPTDPEKEPETIGILRVGDTLTLTMEDHIELENGEKIDALLVIILTR